MTRTKADLASYMTALISIMESKEDAGIARGNTLAREYNRAYDELIDLIKKDEDDETRKRTQQPERSEGRTADTSGESRGRGSIGTGFGT